MPGQNFHEHGWINEKPRIHSRSAWWGNRWCKEKKYKKLDRNIKCVKNELLDPEVLSKLI